MTPFNVRTATPDELLERADYLKNFPATSPGYKADLLAEAEALRDEAIHRHVASLEH